MKTIYKFTLLSFILFSCGILKSQQEEYSAYLEQALKSVENNDEKNFIANMKYFSVAIEKDQITPQILNEENFKLYSKCLYRALTNKITISDNIAKQAFVFLEYNIEKYPENMASLGYLYGKGLGIEQDYIISKQWYERAAEKNVDYAMYSLGLFYALGWGIEEDYDKGFYWFEKAALMEHSDAMYNLGIFYTRGLGAEKSYKNAIYWFQKAAEKENLSAMYNLAVCYYYGDGVDKNYAESKKWVEKILEIKDDDKALHLLGDFYRFGESVTKDKTKALSYYKKACALGNQKACSDFDDVTNYELE